VKIALTAGTGDQRASQTDDAIWCVEANIVAQRRFGPGGLETTNGTKHFRGGSKVYIMDWFQGECQAIVVIGHHRKSRRLINIVVSANVVRNLRVKMVYSPTVVSMIEDHYRGKRSSAYLTKEKAEQMLKAIPGWQTL
jgi:hypothetical protein